MNEARHANEIKSNIGQDINLAFELSEYEAEQEAEADRPEPSLKYRKVVSFERGRKVVREFVGPYQI
jgi:hypothetical protein